MALIKCPECGREVSDRATACPNCGYPIAEMEAAAPQEVITTEESPSSFVIQNETDAPQERIPDGKNEWCLVIPFTVSFLKCGYVTTELLEKGHITPDEKIRFVQNKDYPFLLKSELYKAEADIIADIVLRHQIPVQICRVSEWEQNEFNAIIYPRAEAAEAPATATNEENQWCAVIPYKVAGLIRNSAAAEMREKGLISDAEKNRFEKNDRYFPFLLKSGLTRAEADAIRDVALSQSIPFKACTLSQWEAEKSERTLQAPSGAAETTADGKALASPEEVSAAKRSAKRVGILWAVVLGLFVLLVIIKAVDSAPSTYKYSSSNYTSSYSSGSTSSSSSGRSSSSSKYSNDDYETALYLAAKKAVSKYLKAPSTATFGKQSDCVFEIGDGGTYMMAGVVDSQNSYGASLRETWAVMATVEDNKMVVFVVTIGDNTYFP